MICTCEDIYNEEITCSLIGNALDFNSTSKCKRCTYVSYGCAAPCGPPEPTYTESNATLRLYPVDCEEPDLNITNYICQKR